MSIEAAIALNRFGLGARAQQKLPDQPKKYLLDQLQAFDPAPPALAALPNPGQIAQAYEQYTAERQMLRQVKNSAKKSESEAADSAMLDEKRKMARRDLNEIYVDAANARLSSAINTRTDFAERLVHFWANHFAVSADKPQVTAFAGNHEFTAIRPNIMGKFSNLLLAATLHPAMQVYLDQERSVGPGSPLAQRLAQRRNREFGLNENLAREILELHTLGVRSVYGQTDVTELARALTGWTTASLAPPFISNRLKAQVQPGETVFFDEMHEPGPRKLLGKSYSQLGRAQSVAILADIAVHPATAKHIARKLAQHFVADDPPASLTAKLEKNFLQTGGDLPSLYRTLVEAPEAWPAKWDPTQAKFKSPWDWVTSSLRAMNNPELPGGNKGNIAGIFKQLGQPIWRPGSPAGFADTTQNWAGGAALMRRFETASRIARLNANNVDARSLAGTILPGILNPHTAENIARAESPMQGLSLLLVSPEFLRR
jgi:uncharacterized protein (DUF1800 family)